MVATSPIAGETYHPQVLERPVWREIRPEQLGDYDHRLLQTDAHVLQYPYWNQPYRRLGFRPTFLTWGVSDQPEIYVCILCAGLSWFQIGLIMRGPVSLVPGREVPQAALDDLYEWAKANRFVFLRFTHCDQRLLDHIAGLGRSDRVDAFPFYEDMAAANHDLLIRLAGDDAELLQSFDKEIRRQIRRAADAGYTIEWTDTAEAMKTAWPFFVECGQRKGFRLQKPLEAYLDLVRLGRLVKCVRIYSMYLSCRPVQFALVVRDRSTAWNVLLARDTQALQGHPSPGGLMHWQIMRDLRGEGVSDYNLGLAVGTVGPFKLQFRPRMQTYPPPVTLVSHPGLYGVWTRLLPITKFLMPAIRPLMLWMRGKED